MICRNIGVDTGEGLGQDYSVISVIDEDAFQCAEWRSNLIKPYEYAELVYKLALFYIIDKELSDLQPKEVEIEDATHEEKITILKYYLEQSVHPSDNEDIPEDVIRAFVEKIVAHKDGFDWYLRFSPDKPPKTLGIDGKRQNTAKVSSLCLPQHKRQITVPWAPKRYCAWSNARRVRRAGDGIGLSGHMMIPRCVFFDCGRDTVRVFLSAPERRVLSLYHTQKWSKINKILIFGQNAHYLWAI